MVNVMDNAMGTAVWQDESGQDLIEYALMACLVALGAIASVKGVTNWVVNEFNSIASTITANT